MNLSTLKGSFLSVGLLLWLWLFAGLLPAAAVHLMGGEMTYKYLDSNGPLDRPWRYEITMRVYYNPLTDPADNSLAIQVQSRITLTNPFGMATRVARTSSTEITVPALPGCSQAVPRVALGLYVVTVNLPVNYSGFRAVCGASDRVAGITNLMGSSNTGMVLAVDMLPATIPNSSPVFSSIPVALICLGANSFVPNNAYDADGDELVYLLSTPVAGYSLVQYAPGYSATRPFGTTGALSLDATTGLSTYLSATQGVFQVAVDVQEYRVINGLRQLLSTVHRDVQLVARACTGASSQPPAFTPATLAQRNFQLDEGQTLAFNVAATDADGDPLTLTASSALLDGPGGIEASFGNQPGAVISTNLAGQAAIKGTGTVTGTFRLAGCGMDRRAPYEVMVTATDEVCNSQTVVAMFRITVNRPGFSGAVRGAAVVCAQSTATYTVVGGGTFGAYQWTAQGGQVLGPASGPTAQVLWGPGGPGTVRLAGITSLGCPTQSVAFPVFIGPGLAVEGPAGYCLTAATGLRYTVPGAASNYQWTIADGTIVSGQGTNEVLVDIPPGATATLQVANPALIACVTTLRIAPDDRCLYFYNVITPNGDTQNETFVIKNIERHPNTALTIFNRWGRKVYHSDDYQNTFGGGDNAPGLYYYLCQTTDGTSYKGSFEVIR